jgi:cytochrome d ubiquinol oxidase subunit II
MELYTILQFLGWLAVGLIMYLFAATGGFDLGAGMLTPFIGKTDAERRVVINTVGPTWDGNQVWLITAGGAIFAIFPRVYAASFSGFYFGILAVLWALFFRPVAFEFRSKIETQRWRSFWDWALCIGSFVPALVIGVAIGNLFLGVPFQVDPITLRFMYGANPSDPSALIDLLMLLRPFALLVGIVCVLMMLMHGSAYLVMRTSGVILARAKAILKVSAILVMLGFIAAGVWLMIAMPQWLTNYHNHWWLWFAPLLGLLGAIGAIRFSSKGCVVKAFSASCVSLLGILGTMGYALFPYIMVSSTNPTQSLIVWNSTSSQTSLTGILVCAVIMLPIIFYYTHYVYRKLWGRDVKMSVEKIAQENHVLY